MAIDSKVKRGSVIHVKMPFRRWKAEPDGTFDSLDRQSLALMPSTVQFTLTIAPVAAPFATIQDVESLVILYDKDPRRLVSRLETVRRRFYLK